MWFVLRKKTKIVYNYEIYGTVLATKTEVRDLGVTFSSDGNFHEHIINITNEALKTLGFINRNFKRFYDPTTY